LRTRRETQEETYDENDDPRRHVVASMTLPASALTCHYTSNGASYGVSQNYPVVYVAYASHSAKRSGIKRHMKRSRSLYSTRERYIGSDPDPRGETN
jgi:hypothetical protein